MIIKMDCIYCHERLDVDTDNYDEGAFYDGEIFEIDCPYCKNSFDAEADVTVTLKAID